MENNKRSQNKWFDKRNIINLVFFVLLAIFVLSTNARVVFMRGLMKVGLFSPGFSSGKETAIAIHDVAFQDKDGKQVNIASLRGKVVFINFWATWCPPCIAELPSIADLHNRLKSNSNIVFLMVDADGDISKSLPFMGEHGYPLPVFISASRVPQIMMGNAIPITFVIDKGGKIAFRHDGLADYSSKKFIKFLVELAGK